VPAAQRCRTDNLEWYRIAFAGFRTRGTLGVRGFGVSTGR
jgi:hypothetical protein